MIHKFGLIGNFQMREAWIALQEKPQGARFTGRVDQEPEAFYSHYVTDREQFVHVIQRGAGITDRWFRITMEAVAV